jgi:anti-sigma factor RsiW
VQCDDVALVLPRFLDGGEPLELSVARHVETCVRCQAELARYHKLLRALRALRTQYLEPAPGLLTQTLAALEEAGERRAVRSIVTGRRVAYAGAIGGAAVAAGTAATLVLVARSKKRAMRLAG